MRDVGIESNKGSSVRYHRFSGESAIDAFSLIDLRVVRLDNLLVDSNSPSWIGNIETRCLGRFSRHSNPQEATSALRLILVAATSLLRC